MRTNVKVLGWLYVVLGVLGALVGITVLVILSGTGVLVQDRDAMTVLTIVGLFVAGIMTLLSAPGVIVGVGLLNFRPWSRVLALVLGALNLPAFPLGTALGIYTFVSLLNEDAERLFRR